MKASLYTLLEMITVMMKTTTLNVNLTMVTVVAQMSIQIIAQNVNASVMKDQLEEMDQLPHL